MSWTVYLLFSSFTDFSLSTQPVDSKPHKKSTNVGSTTSACIVDIKHCKQTLSNRTQITFDLLLYRFQCLCRIEASCDNGRSDEETTLLIKIGLYCSIVLFHSRLWKNRTRNRLFKLTLAFSGQWLEVNIRIENCSFFVFLFFFVSRGQSHYRIATYSALALSGMHVFQILVHTSVTHRIKRRINWNHYATSKLLTFQLQSYILYTIKGHYISIRVHLCFLLIVYYYHSQAQDIFGASLRANITH